MRLSFCLAAAMLSIDMPASAQKPPSKEPADSRACSVLTKEDAAAALGEAVTKGPQASAMAEGPSSCEYSGSGIHSVNLNLIPLNAANAAMYKMMCAQKSKEGLTGLGDTTCWYNAKHGELQVLKGTTFFSIELRRSGDPTEPIKAVARKVYDRLK
jgi:hypothetical protein